MTKKDTSEIDVEYQFAILPDAEENSGEFRKQHKLTPFKPPIIATYDKHVVDPIYNTHLGQVGELVDMWADLIENRAKTIELYWNNFAKHLHNRKIKTLEVKWDDLMAEGVFPPTRKMLFIKRGVVTLTVYMAQQGTDLYVSWRAFMRGEDSVVRWLFWFLTACAVGMVGSAIGDIWYTIRQPLSIFNPIPSSSPSTEQIVGFAIGFGLVVLWTAGFGMFRRADIFALVRQPLNELQVDDLLSLAEAVHNSLLEAADELSIDVAKLEPRVPFYKSRRPRI